MPLVNLPIPPGIHANGEIYQVGSQGRWYRGNLVRWQQGLLAPVGGWRLLNPGAMTGVVRGLHSWRDLLNRRFLAAGTEQALYTWDDDVGTDITPDDFEMGREDAVYGVGYGTGAYGAAEYGTPRQEPSTRLLLDATSWSLDNWGEDLVSCANHEGNIYSWSPDDLKAAIIPNAPTQCTGILVTPERMLLALGASGNSRKLKWSHREDRESWAPSALTTAGEFELQTSGRIQTAIRVRGEILVLTDTDAWQMQFIGVPFVYSFNIAGTACGVFGPRAVAAVASFAAWFGPGGFFVYNGAVEKLQSEVQDYVLSDYNPDQASKFFVGANTGFNEMWFFYCSSGSLEIDRYAIWNYAENHWSLGHLARTAWEQQGVFNRPILGTPGGLMFEHEAGWTANGAPILNARYVESGGVSIGDAGDLVYSVLHMVPDERSLGGTRAVFKTRFAPHDVEREYGPYDMANFTDVRFQARQVSVRIEGNSDSDWRIGLPRLDIFPGGRR